MICCGKEIETPFCPYCGKLLRDPNPLESLLEHVRKRIKQSKQELARRENWTQYEDYAPQRRRSIAKWQAWETALSAIVYPDKELAGKNN